MQTAVVTRVPRGQHVALKGAPAGLSLGTPTPGSTDRLITENKQVHLPGPGRPSWGLGGGSTERDPSSPVPLRAARPWALGSGELGTQQAGFTGACCGPGLVLPPRGPTCPPAHLRPPPVLGSFSSLIPPADSSFLCILSVRP